MWIARLQVYRPHAHRRWEVWIAVLDRGEGCFGLKARQVILMITISGELSFAAAVSPDNVLSSNGVT